MAYTFSEPAIASIRIPIGLNADGEIAVQGDDVAGSKNLQFTYTKRDATAQEILFGDDVSSEGSATTTGIVSTFLTFMLGAYTDPLGMKRTIVQPVTSGM